MKSAAIIGIKTEYPTISAPPTLLFNLLVLIWWLEVGLRIAFLGSIRFELILATLVSAIALARFRSTSRSREKSNSDIVRCIAAYIIVLFLSLPLALDFDVAWSAFINHVVKYAVLGILISQYVVSPSTLRAYLFTSLVAFLKIGQEAFVGKITGSQVWENQGVLRLHGAENTMFGDPNSLSGKTVSALPFVWYVFPVIKAKWIKLLFLLELVFAINIIVFTASRTGYIAFIAVSFFIVTFSGAKRKRAIALFMVLAFVAVTFVPKEYQDRFLSSFSGEESVGHSKDTRIGLLHDSWTVFSENPFGVGLNCFPVAQAIANRNVQETHNLYTQILAETGVQGLVCFALLLRAILRKAFLARNQFRKIVDKIQALLTKASINSREALERELLTNSLFLATTNALIVFVMTRLVLGFFGHDLLEIYWWLAAGMAMAMNNLLQVSELRVGEISSKVHA